MAEMTAAFRSRLAETNVANTAASSSERHAETPHTRACTNCVRAKSKCAPSADAAGKCERYRAADVPNGAASSVASLSC
jgi:hypothetical protein